MQKLVLSEDFIRFPDAGISIPVKTQEWALNQALLCREKLHWLDGFLVFDTWLKGKQTGSYKDRFKTIASKAARRLKEIGFQAKVSVIRRGQGYYRLTFSAAVGPENNVRRMAQLLDQSCRLFVLGNNSGWDLVKDAMAEHFEPTSFCRALVQADGLPEDMDLWAEPLDRIMDLMKHYRIALAEAVTKVSKKVASKNNQGITFSDAAEPLAGWVLAVVNVNKILQLLGGHAKPRCPDKRTNEDRFLGWIRSLVDCIEECLEAAATGDPEAQAIRNEQSSLLEEVAQSSLVQKIKQELLRSYEEGPHPAVESEDVEKSIRTALYETALLHRDNPRCSDAALLSFRKLLVGFAERQFFENRICKQICGSVTLEDTHKSRQILSLLKQVMGEDDLDEPTLKKVKAVILTADSSSNGHVVPVTERPHFRYLRPIEQVLRIEMPEEPKWFRKTGPIAADFDDGRVYIREGRLKELEALVISNPVSMLEGIAATGKTVLAFSLAYRLYKEKHRTYYFDCDKKRDFDEGRLVDEIRKAEKAYFIIENVHLAPQTFQAVYSEFKHHEDRNILFVSRPSYREFQYSRSEDLREIPSLSLEPFDEVDAIIKNYISHSKTPSIHERISEQIKTLSWNDLWLLSYALDGCTGSGENGNPKVWLEKGVKEDLKDLKNMNRFFPEVLVTISPLYRNEVLIAESYLTNKLEFDYGILDQLVMRGEITRQTTEEDIVFYGLPHSALAEAYWNFGQEYKRRRGLPKYEDFIYDYAVSDTPNGLEAVVETREDVQQKLLVELGEDGELPMVIRKERSHPAVALYLSTIDPNVIGKDETLSAIAWRIESLDNPSYVPDILSAVYSIQSDAGKQVWKRVNKKRLFERIIAAEDFVAYALCVSVVLNHGDTVATEFTSSLSIERLAQELNVVENSSIIVDCITAICGIDRQAGRELWRLLKKQELMDKLCKGRTLTTVLTFIQDIRKVNWSFAEELLDLLTPREVATKLGEIQDGKCMRNYIYRLSRERTEICREALRLLDTNHVVKVLSRAQHFDTFLSSLRGIHTISEEKARKIVYSLNLTEIAGNLDRLQSVGYLAEHLAFIFSLSKKTGEKLWKLLDREKLARRVSCEVLSEDECACIDSIYAGSPEAAHELCGTLDVGGIAAHLNRAKDAVYVAKWVTAVGKANHEIGQELWRLLNKYSLSVKLNSTRRIHDVVACVTLINAFDPKLACEVCNFLDIHRLAARAYGTKDVASVIWLVRSILMVNERVGGNICRILRGRGFVTKIAQSTDFFGVMDCIERTTDEYPDVASKLCALLGLEKLPLLLDCGDSVSELGACVGTIVKANRTVGRKLWELVDKCRFATALSRESSIWTAKSCLEFIQSADATMAKELSRLLDLNELAVVLKSRGSNKEHQEYLEVIGAIEPEVRRRLESLLMK